MSSRMIYFMYMKELTGAVIIFFLSLFVYTKFAGPIPFSVSSIVTTKTDTFTVTGEGKATAIPDVAVVSVGVQAQGTTVALVQQQLNKKTNAVIDAIKKLGIDAKDIQTSNYNISPQYNFQEPTQRIVGYQASSNLTVKVRQMDKANTVVDAATNQGANVVGGISFEVSDRTQVESEARGKAVVEAKKKAVEASKAAGFSLGRVINYSGNFGGVVRPVPMFAKSDAAGLGAAESAPTQIEPGSSEITVDVSLSYEIR